jgi:hypothetical protein
MDIAVMRASGDVGRAIATRLLGAGLLERHERLQLVGRRGGDSERVLEGFTADLLDAFAEQAPVIDVALEPSEIAADLTDRWALISEPEPTVRGFLRGSIDSAEVGRHVEVFLDSDDPKEVMHGILSWSGRPGGRSRATIAHADAGIQGSL